jgi:hypothetical protein
MMLLLPRTRTSTGTIVSFKERDSKRTGAGASTAASFTRLLQSFKADDCACACPGATDNTAPNKHAQDRIKIDNFFINIRFHM